MDDMKMSKTNEFTLLNGTSKANIQFDQSRRNKVPIYQIVVGKDNISAGTWCQLVCKYSHSHPFDSVFTVPSIHLHNNKHIFKFQTFIFDYVPACFFDLCLFLLRKKPKMLNINQQIRSLIDVLSYFMTKQWTWQISSTKTLQASLSEKDQKTFNILPDTVNWSEYVKRYVIGCKKFVVKETKQSYQRACERLWRLRIIKYLFQVISVLILYRLFVSKSSMPRIF